MSYSLKTLLLACTIVAFGCAGLNYATTIWATGFFTVALIALLCSLVGIVARRQAARAYWIGFFIVGGGYFVAAYFDGSELYKKDDLQYREPRLVTTQMLMKASTWGPKRLETGGSNQSYYEFGGKVYMKEYFDANFVQVGHGLFTLLFGLFGGLLGSRLYGKEAPRKKVGG